MGRITELKKKIADGIATDEEVAELSDLKSEAAEEVKAEADAEADASNDAEKQMDLLVAKFLKKVTAAKSEETVETKVADASIISKEQYKSMDKDAKVKNFITALLENNHQKLQVMAEGTNALGGYLVPDEWYQTIVEELRNDTVIRPRAKVISMKTNQLNITQLATRPKVYWRGEAATKSTSTAEFAQISLTPYSLAVIVVMTKELVADATIGGDIISFMTDKIVTAIAEEEDKAFMTGNGSGRPTGIDNYAATVHRIVATPANVLAADSLIEVVSRLGTKYLRNAVWIMNSVTYRKAMQLKDSQNRYLFVPAPNTDSFGTILGYPVLRQDDLAQNHIWFGDLKGYWIGVREGISIMQSEEAQVAGYSLFERNEIALRVEERIDGELADLDSFVCLTGTN
jgi:HK97 family phage major capsid protein